MSQLNQCCAISVNLLSPVLFWVISKQNKQPTVMLGGCANAVFTSYGVNSRDEEDSHVCFLHDIKANV